MLPYCLVYHNLTQLLSLLIPTVPTGFAFTATIERAASFQTFGEGRFGTAQVTRKVLETG